MRKSLIAALLVLLYICACVPAFAAPEVGTGFHSGLLLYKDPKTGSYGYVDKTGNIVIEPQYYQAANFDARGFAWVGVKKKNAVTYYYIDTDGKTIGKPLANASKISYALVIDGWYGDYGFLEKWKYNAKKKMDKPFAYQIIDSKGKLLVKTEFTYVSPFDENGLALVGTGDVAKVADQVTRIGMGDAHWLGILKGNNNVDITSSYYFIDKKGKQLGKKTYAVKPGVFSEGLAAVPGKPNAKGEALWGYINVKGEQVIDFQYQSASAFSNGLAIVKKANKYGMIDQNGKEIVPLIWDSLYQYSEGLALVKLNERWGYIDQNGNTIIEPQYESAMAFSNGLGLVKQDGKFGCIDTSGQWVIEPQYSSRYGLPGQYILFKNGIAWGATDHQGQETIPFAYESIQPTDDPDLFICKEYAAPVIVNEDGRLITIVLEDGGLPTHPFEEGTKVSFIAVPDSPLGFFADEQMNVVSMNTFSRPEGESFHITTGSGRYVIMAGDGRQLSGPWDEVTACKAGGKTLFIVKENNLYGLVSAEGKTLIAPKYSKIHPFSEDVCIATDTSSWYIINENGEVIF